jgi:hypothetical protein
MLATIAHLNITAASPTLDYFERTYLQQTLPRQRADAPWPWMAEREAMQRRIEEADLARERDRNLNS